MTTVTDRLYPLDAAAHRWVDSVMASLDGRGRAAQLVMAWTSGRYVPMDSPELEALLQWVEAGVGGIIVSIGPPVALAEKLNRLQRHAAVPLLVSTDMEHGPAQRLRGGLLLPWGTDLGGGTEFPPVMALAAAGDPDLARELGRVTAREARAVGIHLNFAPVADVNNNPANPIINTRSYGEDPAAVSAFVRAHIRGLQDHGMLATAKHFPGHGDVTEDTHLVPYTLGIDRARAEAVELVPFRAAIDEGVAAVMTAHIAFPALSGDAETPATLSPELLDGLLARELAFDGLVVTDALNMGAIVARYGEAEAAVLAVEAGADILLQPPDPLVVIDALDAALASGRLTQERIDRSARKILEAKARVGLHVERTVALDGVAHAVGAAPHRALADRIAERAVTLVRDRAGLVPLDAASAPRVLVIVYTDDVSPFAGRHLLGTLAAGLPALDRAVLGPGEHPAALAELAARARGADRVVFVADVRVRSGKGSVAVEEPVAAMLRGVAREQPTILVSLGSPYVLLQMPELGSYLVGWGGDRSSQEAVASALLGHAAIGGTLPISIPPLHRRGDGIRRGPGEHAFSAVDSLVQAAVDARVTPGAVVAIGGPDGVRHMQAFGAVDYAAGAAAVTDSTIWDLASLTKVLATTTAVMRLVEEGRVGLDDPLHRYLSAWPRGGWRDQVTVRRLLTHSAGLTPFVRFWHPSGGGLRGKDAVVSAITALPAAYPPGSRMTYSDLGFILLAAMVEEVTGMPLDEGLRPAWSSLGLAETGFRPLEWAPAERIAPTEVDRAFRGTHVHGVVHDENAYIMGGVAGHAGLFGSARDVARFAADYLSAADRSPVVQSFVARDAATGRALGWDAAPGSGGIGRAFSDRAFGHTGFTGTSVWLDPDRGLFVVLLTNRVNPTREGAGVADLRRAVHAAAVHAADRHLPRPSQSKR
jgi:beta-N-acetylhexosaminidase